MIVDYLSDATHQKRKGKNSRTRISLHQKKRVQENESHKASMQQLVR